MSNKESKKEFDVAIHIKVYVDDPKSINSVKTEIDKLAKVGKSWEEDVGFGIKVLKMILMLQDSEGGMDKLEEQIKKLKGVSEMEIEDISRV